MATKKKPAKKSLPRIFVSIASYRDPDCQNTVKDLFEKAAHPERIFVGLCWQYVKGEDDFCFEVPYPRPKQVRVHEMDARKAKGVCYARSLIQKLWKGEEFTFQIDSHMRFEPGWDDLLVSMWEQCHNKKAVLTCYPPGFTPPDTFLREWVFGMAAQQFDPAGILLMHGKPAFSVHKPPPEPVPGAFAGCCMLFAPSSIVEDVPYDPYLYFFGEEISMAVRLWTHGYDLYHPNRLVVFHDWDRTKRKTHFDDHRDWVIQNERSFARVRHLLGTERSSHPDVVRDLDRYGLGKARTLAEYEAYSGVNFAAKTISGKAASGMYPLYADPAKNNAPAKTARRKGGKQPRIFVNIASYRDRECQWTVKDLFEKASYPDRINVGICWQFDEAEDQDCFQVVTRPDQVRVFPVDWREAEGVCWARHMTQQLWDGEEYTLMIDSHMRFVPGWDEMMFEELAACDSKKPVLSSSPAGYTPPNNLSPHVRPTVRRAMPFMTDGNIRCRGEMLDRAPEKPLRGAFMVANFVFSRSEIIKDVPYDPYLYFDQEEITYAVRLFTHGWDIFSTRRQFLYHYYNVGDNRPLHWKDLAKEDNERIRYLRSRGLKRFNHMTGYEKSTDPDVTKELKLYGFGKKRTLKQFEEYSGVDFKRKIASEKALRALFVKDLKKYRDSPIPVPELDDPAAKAVAAHGASHPGSPLERGDFVPFFQLQDTYQRSRAIETFGGKHVLLFFLPAGDEEYLKQFFKSLEENQPRGEKLPFGQVFVLGDTVAHLAALKAKLKISQALWADPDSALASAFGFARPGDKKIPPAGYLLNNNLKIVQYRIALDPQAMVKTLVNDLRASVGEYHGKHANPLVISEISPVLIVPHAFTPEFCEKCIRAFRTGRTADGGVGAEAAYRPESKVRTDFIVGNDLIKEIDEKLSRSLFPEIQKVFGFEVTHRERYKVGLYSGEKKGFFKQHRDNFEPPMGYRRVAMTIQLTDNYEGGGVRFPEYDENVYRPARGSAIIFSSGTMHEALPVTKGERIILVGFFHNDEDEGYYLHHRALHNKPLRPEEHVPALKTYPRVRQSRDFYRDWRKKNVHLGPVAAAPAARPAQVSPPRQQQAPVGQGAHQPRKTFESGQVMIFDDFLPEDVYQKIHHYALRADYERINAHGKLSRAWHVHDGSPLRSSLNLFYYTPTQQKPEGRHVYPTHTPLDAFMDHLLAVQPQAEHITGRYDEGWGHVSATSWIYPPGTGLSMHDDGSGVYAGAYVYYLNPVWKSHWGGLNIMMDEETNLRIQEYRNTRDQMEFYEMKWLNANAMEELVMERGFAKCIFPKKNRLVFIANDAYHMVTRVNESAGDNVRMSLAGFFNYKKPPKGGGGSNDNY